MENSKNTKRAFLADVLVIILSNVNQFVADGYQAVEQDGVITVTASR